MLPLMNLIRFSLILIEIVSLIANIHNKAKTALLSLFLSLSLLSLFILVFLVYQLLYLSIRPLNKSLVVCDTCAGIDNVPLDWTWKELITVMRKSRGQEHNNMDVSNNKPSTEFLLSFFHYLLFFILVSNPSHTTNNAGSVTL